MATLTPQQQAEADRAALSAFGQTVMGGMRSLGAAANDIGTLIPRGIAGAANTLIRLPNAFGANIPYAFADNPAMTTSMTPYSDALNAGKPAAAMPAPTAAAAPARTAAQTQVEPTKVVAAAAGPAAATTKKGGGTAAAPAPREAGAPALIPGETGFYMNDQLVPYGTRFNVGPGGVTQLDNFASTPAGAGGPALAAGGSRAAQVAGAAMPTAGATAVAGQSSLIDPREFFQQMVRAQMSYADRAAESILSQAGSGRDLGYSARLRALASVYLNGLAGQGQGGANSFNSATASMQNAQVGAQASMFNSNNALTGDLARSNATLGAAQISADSNDRQIDAQNSRFDATAQPIGQTMVPGPGGMPMAMPTYGVPQRKTGGMPKAITQLGPQAMEGDKGVSTGPDGKQRATVYKNGKWVLEGN